MSRFTAQIYDADHVGLVHLYQDGQDSLLLIADEGGSGSAAKVELDLRAIQSLRRALQRFERLAKKETPAP